MGLEVVPVADTDALARAAADLVVEALDRRPGSFVAATGTTPMPTYAELARRARSGTFDVTSLHAFQLDEYVGVGRDDRRSLTGWFDRSVVGPLGIADARVVRFDGLAPDPTAECRRYDEAVARAPFDVAILGLGPNGHLGFNEPPSGADAPTRVVALAPESVRSNAGYWGSEADVPTRAITAGMAQLLSARRVVLVVSGHHKRGILRQVTEGAVSDDVPASHLQHHPEVIVVATADALDA